MALYRYSDTDLEPIRRTTLVAEQIREREDIQRLLLKRIGIINEDFLAVAEEYSLFEDSRRRVDLLALDRRGSLVVIELKRTDDGGHMELQALRYAAMVSTMTLDHLVQTFADFHAVTPLQARETILDWVDEPMDELPNHVRIVLVSGDFSTEVTSTVLWLNENYNTDISCYRIVPYRLESETLLDLQQIIPLPEAKQFQIQQRKKVAASTAVQTSGRDFTRYDIQIAGGEFTDLSKQAAVKKVLQLLHLAGVSIATLMEACKGSRWVAVHPSADETVAEAFAREYPGRSSNHLWFDLDIRGEGTTWVTPRFGGADTESILDALALAASPAVSVKWARRDREASGDSSA
ncbi:endonuclease NucS domain-containing protein [Mycetocola zhadangensis]|nr:endonuclease NucS domain-containing protein [Mycetocola zhadangensis]GGE99832.1 hypothetical protein GCM10011313_23440 [Mycetocola zhadangensis]